MPFSTSRSFRAESRPTRSVRKRLSSVTIRDTFTTHSLSRPTLRRESDTFPGAYSSVVLDATVAAMTVHMRLRLNASACITTTGRRNPGSDPEGSGISAHHTSPRRITRCPSDSDTVDLWSSLASSGRASPAAAWGTVQLSHRCRGCQ